MRDKRGRFLPGPDKDRHQLTRAERRRGYQTTAFGGTLPIGKWRWVMRKIARQYGRGHLGLPDDVKEALRRKFGTHKVGSNLVARALRDRGKRK